MFVARETGRGDVKHLGHEIQVSRLGGFDSREPRSSDLSNIVAAFATQTDDARDDGASRRSTCR